jgi:hypothetical protein
MRCPKCGRISFDYLENCLKCGHDLREISAGLGCFAKPDPKIVLLGENSKAGVIKTELKAPVLEQEAGKSVDLSQIDVSDLVDDSNDTDMKEIDPVDLKKVADDKDFQQALDQAIKHE